MHRRPHAAAEAERINWFCIKRGRLGLKSGELATPYFSRPSEVKPLSQTHHIGVGNFCTFHCRRAHKSQDNIISSKRPEDQLQHILRPAGFLLGMREIAHILPRQTNYNTINHTIHDMR